MVVAISFWLCGCATFPPPLPPLTPQEESDLSALRNAPKDARGRSGMAPFMADLITGDPVGLAKQASRRGDFRLIGMAMGYGARAADAEPFAVACSFPVATQDIVFGCVPPPTVVFKMMLAYNQTLVREPAFPYRDRCRIREDVARSMRSGNGVAR